MLFVSRLDIRQILRQRHRQSALYPLFVLVNCEDSIESAWKGKQRFIGDLWIHYSHFIGSVLDIS